jgi:hypothetical protein
MSGVTVRRIGGVNGAPGQRLVHSTSLATRRRLVEDHLDDDGCDCGEREHYQDINNPERDQPATLLFPLAPPECVEIVGIRHVPSTFRQVRSHDACCRIRATP